MKNEIEKLLLKGTRSLNVAKLLFKSGDYDFAASRLYYALFYTVEALLLSKEFSFSKHAAVISAFYEHFVKTQIFPKKMHQLLHAMFNLRQEGDYLADMVPTKEMLKEYLSDSESFIVECKKYLEEK